MKATRRISVAATTAVLAGGVALLPASPATAAPKNVSCMLTDSNAAGWKTCVKTVKIPAKKAIRIELVSSGNKKLSFAVTDAKGKTLGKQQKLKPGDGYKKMWTNSGGKAKNVKIKAKKWPVSVDVKANFRYNVK